jgi:formamidopyrimidine-DNA glycosylase
MPELPEVETIRRGLEPRLIGRRLHKVEIFEPRLRFPVAQDLPQNLTAATIVALRRRGKYLLLETEAGVLIIHLGMSGSLRLTSPELPRRPHDHAAFTLDTGQRLVFHDPRRFGALIWTQAPDEHPLLSKLGVEPFDPAFNGEWLYRISRARRQAVKSWMMDQQVIAGVGNIYANEALFHARIHPARPAQQISQEEYHQLTVSLRHTLAAAIAHGGTTLRDFSDAAGRPGYFQLTLQVYARAGQPCSLCTQPIQRMVLGQRATYYCARCQK